jgi:U3 small nucleolar RNA-associated protein MPP10
MNSLLEVHLDFNVASKLPPQITQEKTNGLEAIIKQRIMDELFDDPIRKYIKGGKENDNEDVMDFSKSKRGLGE